MAVKKKRFTDTNKWKDSWFKSLSLKAKLAWIYLCDDCDHSGIWIIDYEVMTLRLGFTVNDTILADLIGDKLVKLSSESIFIPSFFNFQYGESKDTFNAKVSAINILKSYGLIDEGNEIRDLNDSLMRVTSESQDSLINININIKSKSKSSEQSDIDLEALYQLYPKRPKGNMGKASGMDSLARKIKSPEKYERLKLAVQNIKRMVDSGEVDKNYIPMWSTFANRFEDYLPENSIKPEKSHYDTY